MWEMTWQNWYLKLFFWLKCETRMEQGWQNMMVAQFDEGSNPSKGKGFVNKMQEPEWTGITTDWI